MGKSVLFEVIVGTYEEFVLGYQFSIDEDSNKVRYGYTIMSNDKCIWGIGTGIAFVERIN